MSNKAHNTSQPVLKIFTAQPRSGRVLTETIQPRGVVTTAVQVPQLISGVKAQTSSQTTTNKAGH
jgi:hypothetical protein